MGRGFDSRRERQVFMQKFLATSVALRNKAVLIQGNAGAGKTFLTLRLIADHGAQLISDDVTNLQVQDGILYAEPVSEIAGQIEVRGIGIVQKPFAEHVPVACLVQLTDASAERMPEDKKINIAGVQIPFFTFDSNFVYNDLQVIEAINYLEQRDK